MTIISIMTRKMTKTTAEAAALWEKAESITNMTNKKTHEENTKKQKATRKIEQTHTNRNQTRPTSVQGRIHIV